MSASPAPPATASRGRLLRGPLLAGLGGAAALTLLHLRDPHDSGSYGYCPYLLLTGHPCPGCGGLRAVNLVTNGDWVGALSSNAMAVGLLAFLAGAWLLWLVRRVGGSDAPFLKPTTAWAWAFLAVALVFGIARLTPQGAWLAP
ncbi:DUF2752 domain-containing protein [Aeromicrobium phragmitis]|uniref:DUF2752 domain-containing protein n=1 Tax=Aeromicrobium phragmitis TaxID=2478914 RepID=A0A3L8PKJ6_9ACTN|nr:DUF2752 domain-containing protein [Aeromicrobium phragmitis]RLV55887.1 DUF2752 domain-containing protein [Aeromicrobium phragmitis]